MSFIVQRQHRSTSSPAAVSTTYSSAANADGGTPSVWDRSEAEQVAARLVKERDTAESAPTGPVSVGDFLANT
jgi:hypothetical protein